MESAFRPGGRDRRALRAAEDGGGPLRPGSSPGPGRPSEEVLVEGVSRRDDTMLNGRTRQGKLLHFPASGPVPRPAPGSLARVTVTAGHPTTCPAVSRR